MKAYGQPLQVHLMTLSHNTVFLWLELLFAHWQLLDTSLPWTNILIALCLCGTKSYFRTTVNERYFFSLSLQIMFLLIIVPVTRASS